MASSIVLNLDLLLYFKYANFFTGNVNAVLEQFGAETVEWTKIALPIGISFFTFQKISYTVDVHRGVHQPLKNVTDYLLYILMFPQMIAGPSFVFTPLLMKFGSGLPGRMTAYWDFIGFALALICNCRRKPIGYFRTVAERKARNESPKKERREDHFRSSRRITEN